MLLSVNLVCFELVYFCVLYIYIAVSVCVREMFIIVVAECGSRCVRGDSRTVVECFTNVCTYIVQTPIV